MAIVDMITAVLLEYADRLLRVFLSRSTTTHVQPAETAITRTIMPPVPIATSSRLLFGSAALIRRRTQSIPSIAEKANQHHSVECALTRLEFLQKYPHARVGVRQRIELKRPSSRKPELLFRATA